MDRDKFIRSTRFYTMKTRDGVRTREGKFTLSASISLDDAPKDLTLTEIDEAITNKLWHEINKEFLLEATVIGMKQAALLKAVGEVMANRDWTSDDMMSFYKILDDINNEVIRVGERMEVAHFQEPPPSGDDNVLIN
jgi:hypothetical protein